MSLFQFRLVIKRIHLAHAAVHEKLDDTFDLGWMMQSTIEFRAWFVVITQRIETQQMCQGQAAESLRQNVSTVEQHARLLDKQELAAVEKHTAEIRQAMLPDITCPAFLFLIGSLALIDQLAGLLNLFRDIMGR